MEEITPVFKDLLDNPTDAGSQLPNIECFVKNLYEGPSPESEVNKARRLLFAQKG